MHLSKKSTIPSLNTSTPIKVQKPRKIFVEDKKTLLSIFEQVNRRLDDQTNIKQEKIKHLEKIKHKKRTKHKVKELSKK
ncbi:hypothetical protein PCANB_000777 [Pneumocystis canis]|nr:hypothetical protein PCK1_000806 [Pneumocystis canis]KAG5437347.1 hypothetical protein PCANB_000777 [Pneumocystis canis]